MDSIEEDKMHRDLLRLANDTILREIKQACSKIESI